MPFYQNLKVKNKDGSENPTDKRTVERLLELRKEVKKQGIPERTLNKTLLLATWNIRDFDKPIFGSRLQESYYYIAEIISHFDIVAIQEVYKDLTGLNNLMRILGSEWNYLFSDVTEGNQGNDECMAFVYDTRKVRFGGLAGEMVLPPNPDGTPASQIWRTPMICGFRAEWAKFMLCSVHILWGKGSGDSPPDRVAEIEKVAQFLKRRTEDETAWARKLILVGDFNIAKNTDPTFKPLADAGFKMPDLLKDIHTNALKNKQYDKIVFREKENSLNFLKGGAFDFYEVVYKKSDEVVYEPFMGKSYSVKSDGTARTPKQKSDYYEDWRTHQMSDHLPLWVEFEIDFADEYLEDKLKGEN